MTHNPYEQAIEFHEAGYRFFPLWGVNSDGTCQCDNPRCEAIRKHPRHSRWPSTPIWDDDQLQTMQEYTLPGAGYGVLCRGLLVIDVDARNGGVASYERLLERYPDVAGAGLIVETGSGGGSKHLYFTVPTDAALLVHLPEYPGLDFKSGVGHFVVGPGSIHASGGIYQTVEGDPYSISKAPADLLDALKKPERHRAEYNGTYMDVSLQDVADMLRHVSNDDCDYDHWLKIGMAVHHATGGHGYSVFADWSAISPKHDDQTTEFKWHSFGKSVNPVTLGTLIHYAEEGGWVQGVTFTPSEDDYVALSHDDKDDLDFSDVNIKRPPGFAGVLTEWIAAQPMRKRDTIAVGAALVALGNIIGLKYIDQRDRVTGNLFAFCVAGSGTGKNGIQSAFEEIHKVAGLSAAVHGGVKSSKEIFNNLIEHQPAFYNIDEFSDVLEMIHKAKTRGSASYMDTVLATWMSAYSKTNGFLLLNGDTKREVKRDLQARLKRAEDEDRDTESIMRAINGIDKGLEKPLLSLIGYGTPDKFHSLVDFRGATEGFFGRSLIFEERENAPPTKKGYKPTPMPEPIRNAIIQLYQAGEYDVMEGRIEYYRDRKQIPTDAKADALLTKLAERLDDLAAEQAEKTGLEALYLRGYEMISKVSFILGAVEGVRTVEHVRYAAALVFADLELKANLVLSNDRVKDSPAMALRAKIKALCGDEGCTMGVMRHRIRNVKPEDIERFADAMVAEGELVKETTTHPKNKRTSVRYRVT